MDLKLLNDIKSEIISVCYLGLNSINFDLQYTNRKRYWARPGPPLVKFTSELEQWFENHGFKIKPIYDCYGSSTNCDYGCVCHNIKTKTIDTCTKINIEWITPNVINNNNNPILGFSICKIMSCLGKRLIKQYDDKSIDNLYLAKYNNELLTQLEETQESIKKHLSKMSEYFIKL